MQLNYVKQGNGYPTLLIHGLFGSWENLNGLAKSLQDDREVILVDVRNHGRSPHAESMNYLDIMNDFIELMDALDLTQFDVIGHSMGGKIAMLLALLHPNRVRRLVVLDVAPVTYDARHNSIFDALLSVPLGEIDGRKQADAILASSISEAGVRQFLLKSLHKNDEGNYRWRFNLEALHKHYADIVAFPSVDSQFTGPTLFVKGALSNYILPEHRSQITQYFPNSKARVISGTAHWLHAEKPQMVNQSVRDFLLT